jgi:hypothetical protein
MVVEDDGDAGEASGAVDAERANDADGSRMSS